MPSGWGVYYVVFLSAVLALVIPAFLYVFSWLVRARNPANQGAVKPEAPETQKEAERARSRRMNTRFFLGVNVALALMNAALILIPCVAMLHHFSGREGAERALASIVTITVFSALGLFYAARKGDMAWLRSFRDHQDLSGLPEEEPR